MSRRTKEHVTPRPGGNWAVKKEGAERADSIHEQKVDAVERAKELAKNAPLGQVIIHKKDGTIQTEYTYGKDPEKYPG